VRRAAILGLALALGLAAGCGGSSSYRLGQQIDRRPLSSGDRERHLKLLTEANVLWQRRSDPAALAAAIARYQEALAVEDDDWRTYEALARAYFFQADAVFGFRAMGGDYPYVPDSVVDPAADRAYREALRLGYVTALRGMAARSREFEERLHAGISFQRSIGIIGGDAAGLLYWYVSNLALFSRAEGFASLFQNRSRIEAAIYRLYAVAPDVQYRGADRLLGVYLAAAPALVGGDLDKSRAHVEASIRGAPAYLENSVTAAAFSDRKRGDRAAFERRLRAVLAAPPAADPPEIAPDNQVARLKAARLLAKIDRYFHAH
jgi:hypothetical protein